MRERASKVVRFTHLPYIDLSLYLQAIDMSTTTLSSKFQIVIPKEIRDQMGWGAGQKLQAIALNGRVELIAERPIGEMRGFLARISSEVLREGDRV